MIYLGESHQRENHIKVIIRNFNLSVKDLRQKLKHLKRKKVNMYKSKDKLLWEILELQDSCYIS